MVLEKDLHMLIFFSQELAQEFCVCGLFLIVRKNKKEGQKMPSKAKRYSFLVFTVL
jgi:hypothetical protein